MNRAQAMWLVFLALLALGAAIGIPWLVISMIENGAPVLNGAWLLVVICFAGALAAALDSGRAHRAEVEAERVAEAQRQAIREAVAGEILHNYVQAEARRVHG